MYPTSPIDQLDVAEVSIEKYVVYIDVSVNYTLVFDVSFHPLERGVVSLLIVRLTNLTGHTPLSGYNSSNEIETMPRRCHMHIAHYSPV
jgi:hypothetical protein